MASQINTDIIGPVSTTQVDIQGLNPPTYQGSPLAKVSDVVLKAGSTMTGSLVLSGNASSALHAVPKQQLDSAISNVLTILSTGVTGGFVLNASGVNVKIQWMQMSLSDIPVGTTGDLPFSWPTPFTSDCYAVYATIIYTAGNVANVAVSVKEGWTNVGGYVQAQEWSNAVNPIKIQLLGIGN